MSTAASQLRCRRRLAQLLRLLPALDTDYEARYPIILEALASAAGAGYPTGYRIDPKEPEWPVAFIGLPSGQVSWHMPPFPDEWDGHTTEEKYRRCQSFLEGNR